MINNYKDLASTPERKLALDLVEAGIKSVLPEVILPQKLKYVENTLIIEEKKFDLSKGKVYVIGGGKAAGKMAEVLECIIGDKITAGIVNDVSMSATTKIVKINPSGHPIPDKRGVSGVKEMLILTNSLTKNDTVMCLMSGGGSALMPAPVKEVSLREISEITNDLLKSGAEEFEINAVRKHLSLIKGGKLAKYLEPATIITLMISDAKNNNPNIIGSGPTVPDEWTFKDALNVIGKYDVKISDQMKYYLENSIDETPKAGDPCFQKVHNFIIADNSRALNTMKELAIQKGVDDVKIVTTELTGEAKIVSKKIFNSLPNKTCVRLFGGETVVTVRGNGKGGRCQEVAAAAIEYLSSYSNSAFIAVGSDGKDYLPGVGGAVIDNTTWDKAKDLLLDINFYLQDNNTYDLHKKLNTLVLTDVTNTNVRELFVYVKGVNMKRPIIGITMGDPCGIGPEIVVKALSDPGIYELCKPVVVGDFSAMVQALDIANKKHIKIRKVKAPKEGAYEHGFIDLIDLRNVDIDKLVHGKVSLMGGKAAAEYIEKVIDLALKGEVDATTTAPINKKALNVAGYNFHGHTEFYADRTKTEKYSMLLSAGDLRVVHVTTHVPLRDVFKHVNKDRIYDVIKLAHDTMLRIGIENPKIAVCALNPHCGDDGIIGEEEKTEITPAVCHAVDEGMNVQGPIASDTIFSKAIAGAYDIVVAMYHDQGHTPIKDTGYVYDAAVGDYSKLSGVNTTLGLPIIRTSVDHGVAFGKAGKGTADDTSLREAIIMAVKFAVNKE